MKTDSKFTQQLLDWLDKESHDTQEDIMTGARMLLQLNRNQSLYNTISRRPQRFVSKIIYELKKFVPIRLADMTMADVKKMDAEITTEIRQSIGPHIEDGTSSQAIAHGKRTDHDSLPEDIQAIWPANAERWKKIKELYNTLLTIELPCDRYEYLVQMKELWYKYKAEFERYDKFNPDNAVADGESEAEPDAADLVKSINNARAYISKYLEKLPELKAASLAENATEKQIEKYNSTYNNICDRVRVLMENGQAISEETMKKLIDNGIEFIQPEQAETTEDENHED